MADDLDFEAAMAETAPEPQMRPAQVVEPGTFIPGEIEIPLGTDVRPIALSLVPYEQEVKRLISLARDIEVNNEAGRKEATALGLQAKKLRLRVAEIKKAPSVVLAETYLKEVRNLCATLVDPLQKQVENVLREKLAKYSEHQRLEQQRKEAEAREEARRQQAALDAEAARLKSEAEAKAQAAEEELAAKEETGEITDSERALLEQTIEEEREAAETIVAPQVTVHVDQPPTVIRTEEGSSSTRFRWVAELADESLVERKYLVVDMKKVQKDVDAGLRTIPGFVVKEKPITILRG